MLMATMAELALLHFVAVVFKGILSCGDGSIRNATSCAPPSSIGALTVLLAAAAVCFLARQFLVLFGLSAAAVVDGIVVVLVTDVLGLLWVEGVAATRRI